MPPSALGGGVGDCPIAPLPTPKSVGVGLICGGAVATPSPLSKSAVADFDSFIGWPKPAYTRFRLGESWGGGSGSSGGEVLHASTPTPDPSPQGGGEECGGRALIDWLACRASSASDTDLLNARAPPSTISTSFASQSSRCAAAARIIARNFPAAATMAEPPITMEREL